MAETAKVPVGTEKNAEAGAPAQREEAWMPFEALRREVDRLFDDFRPGAWRLPFGRPSAFEMSWPPSDVFRVAPAMDLVEKDGGYEITAELPGMDEKNIEVKLSDNTVTIRGEKTEEKDEQKQDYRLSERRHGSFVRTFTLPDSVNADKISATYGKGVLKLVMPKTDSAKGKQRKIEVKAA
jgi:HSP20 family protein